MSDKQKIYTYTTENGNTFSGDETLYTMGLVLMENYKSLLGSSSKFHKPRNVFRYIAKRSKVNVDVIKALLFTQPQISEASDESNQVDARLNTSELNTILTDMYNEETK